MVNNLIYKVEFLSRHKPESFIQQKAFFKLLLSVSVVHLTAQKQHWSVSKRKEKEVSVLI